MSAGHDHSHDDHGHDQVTVPPFVPENSLHDYFLSFLTVLTASGLVYLMYDWSRLPLPGA